jgi:hypothetical protein
MTGEEELEQLRAERAAWRELAHEKHQEARQLQAASIAKLFEAAF